MITRLEHKLDCRVNKGRHAPLNQGFVARLDLKCIRVRLGQRIEALREDPRAEQPHV